MKGFFTSMATTAVNVAVKTKQFVGNCYDTAKAYALPIATAGAIALGGGTAQAQLDLTPTGPIQTAIDAAAVTVGEIGTVAATSGSSLMLQVVGVSLILMVIGLGVAFIYRFIRAR